MSSELVIPDGRVYLKVIDGSMRGRCFAFDGPGRFLAGRVKEADLQLESDSAVSRRHFFIDVNPPNLYLQDLDSRNGTFVNEQRVRQADLHHGDRIRLGDNVLLVVDGLLQNYPTDRPVRAEIVCARCRRLALGEHPRDPAERVIYYCHECQTSLLASPPLPAEYQFVRKLAHGGMGAVYLAEHEELGVRRAIKILLPELAMSETRRQMFLREARKQASLNHPHIVQVLDLKQVIEGIFCIVMEYVEGESASERLARVGPGGLDPALAIDIAAQALAGLGHAHRQGVIHRDIKDANILIGQGPDAQLVAKLTDFGLAKSLEWAGGTRFTPTRQVSGTVGYMAPEQITNYRDVRESADLYGMGATLYRLLTGHLPHDLPDEADFSTCAMIVLEKPMIPIRKRRPDLPAALAAVVEQSLSMDPRQRFASAMDMRSALLATLPLCRDHTVG